MKKLLSPTAILLFCLAFVWFCSACSTAKIAGPEEDQRLRTLTPQPDMALVYVVRPAGVGGAIRMPVTCDGTPIGSTNGKRYIYAFVKPGKREFISKAENKDELVLVIEAGKTYFFEQKVQMGFIMARNQLERLDETQGRKKLAKCKLAGDCPAYTVKQ